jgi:ABC-type phosphate transport system substrate-binding protein
MFSGDFIQSSYTLFFGKITAPVSHDRRGLPISVCTNITVILLVFSACSQTLPSSSSLSGVTMLVVGSTTLQPLATLAASRFEKDHPQVYAQESDHEIEE